MNEPQAGGGSEVCSIGSCPVRLRAAAGASRPARLAAPALAGIGAMLIAVGAVICDVGSFLLGMYRDTVRSEMSIPGFRSSPCTSGAPHNGFGFAIFRIDSRIS